MVKHGFYKHEACTDMVVEALRVVRVPKGLKVKVAYYSAGYPGKLVAHGETQEVFIAKEDVAKWKRYK